MENVNVRRSWRRHLTGIAALALAAVAADALAQTSGYITDQSGAVWKNGFGSCWRNGSWTTGSASEQCDPDLVPKKAAPKPAPPPPRVTAPKPAPRAPAPRATGPKPIAQRATLAADTLFDFNKSSLKPEGSAALDKLISNMKAINIDSIIAIGHTDRIGGDAYNLKLSQRRAESVKAYLVAHGVPANRISTEGKGKKDPATKPGTCKGPKSKKLIACLQPDRRVEIEVIGTRAK